MVRVSTFLIAALLITFAIQAAPPDSSSLIEPMKVPSTQPFTLYTPPPRDQKLDDMNRLLDELQRARDKVKALKEQSSAGVVAPKLGLNFKPLPPGSKPEGNIEQWEWSVFSRQITRPAVLHITPNVVQGRSGQYMLHQDTPRLVPQTLENGTPYRTDGRGEKRDLDLIDDRPKQK